MRLQTDPVSDVPPLRARPRLRVLTIIDFAVDCGGAERYAVGLARNLPRERIDSWLCATREGQSDFTRQIAASGVPYVGLGRRAKWDVHRLRGLATLLRRERFDVVHAHKFGSNVWGSLFARACGVPVVIAHEHSWSYSGNRLRMWLDGQLVGRLATRFIAVSDLDAERMISIERVPRAKVLSIPTAYVPHGEGTRSDIRVELGVPAETPLIAVVAGLRPPKALDVLIEAHARLDAHSGVLLVLAGEGECRGDLESLTRALGTADRVHFVGARDDVEEIIGQADVAALSSDSEGLPLFVLECMANGTPLVATDVGGLRDVVRNGENGLLVPRRDPVGLADAIASLLNDPARRAEIATAARQTVGNYSLEASGERFADLYESLVAEVNLGAG